MRFVNKTCRSSWYLSTRDDESCLPEFCVSETWKAEGSPLLVQNLRFLGFCALRAQVPGSQRNFSGKKRSRSGAGTSWSSNLEW